jgi:hypothetical protein
MPRSTLRTSLLATLTAFTPLSAAHAQSSAAGTPATVQIAGAALLPERLDLAVDQRVVFRNDSESYARVELDLAHGQGIVCTSDGEPPVRGRKFVVAIGASLECEAPHAAVGYRVFRSGAGGVVESAGRIEVERGE